MSHIFLVSLKDVGKRQLHTFIYFEFHVSVAVAVSGSVSVSIHAHVFFLHIFILWNCMPKGADMQ